MIYSYAELKGRIKVGDKVRAVPGNKHGCVELSKGMIREITEVTDDHFCINDCWHEYDDDCYLDLLTDEPRTLDNLQEGDQVKNDIGVKTVLFVLKPGLYVMSFSDQPNKVDTIFTTKSLEYSGYTLVQPAPPQEPLTLTLKEISEQHYNGRPITIVEQA
jgi:hypothetical protein